MAVIAGAIVSAAVASWCGAFAGATNLLCHLICGLGGLGSGVVSSVFDGVLAIFNIGGFLAAAGAEWHQQKGKGEGAK